MSMVETIIKALLNIVLSGIPGAQKIVILILFATVAVLIILVTH
ncbi:hypothetical protein ACT2EB_18155 [Salmonella enterica subsp. enterica serovar Typhimurium]